MTIIVEYNDKRWEECNARGYYCYLYIVTGSVEYRLYINTRVFPSINIPAVNINYFIGKKFHNQVFPCSEIRNELGHLLQPVAFRG